MTCVTSATSRPRAATSVATKTDASPSRNACMALERADCDMSPWSETALKPRDTSIFPMSVASFLYSTKTSTRCSCSVARLPAVSVSRSGSAGGPSIASSSSVSRRALGAPFPAPTIQPNTAQQIQPHLQVRGTHMCANGRDRGAEQGRGESSSCNVPQEPAPWIRSNLCCTVAAVTSF